MTDPTTPPEKPDSILVGIDHAQAMSPGADDRIAAEILRTAVNHWGRPIDPTRLRTSTPLADEIDGRLVLTMRVTLLPDEQPFTGEERLSEPPPERAILTDLIAALRTSEARDDASVYEAANIAEVRLRELGGDDAGL